MTTAETNLATARAYLKALEEARPQDARQYLSPDIVQIEHPNRPWLKAAQKIAYPPSMRKLSPVWKRDASEAR